MTVASTPKTFGWPARRPSIPSDCPRRDLRGWKTRRTWAGRSAASTQEQGLGTQRLGELDLGPRFAVLVQKLVEPAAVPEALLAGRVLDDSIERDVLVYHDLSHLGSPCAVSLDRFQLRSEMAAKSNACMAPPRRFSRPWFYSCGPKPEAGRGFAGRLISPCACAVLRGHIRRRLTGGRPSGQL